MSEEKDNVVKIPQKKTPDNVLNLPKTKEKDDVVKDLSGRISDPGQSVMATAIAKKIWMLSTKDRLSDTDYTMHDLIISGATGFNPQPPMDYLMVLNAYYTNLYPFIDNLIQEYEHNRESWRIMALEQDAMIKKNSEYITENKILLEYLKDLGTMEGYEGFKTQFKEKYKV